ncbi:dihydrofolate reductase [Corynebacterium sp.]|uniref:dihydrofolate reductase n=1 Tax=Corynebacterium sp. TaxID=1720 RepID=UPI0026DC14C5|nr:dihydrofolate reductase [Corynebacterium sp.]MDO5076293.1 dihydrofolate reductase [Corynebacterium sp.]
MLRAIWAENLDGVLGDGTRMLWHVPEDLAHFKRLTSGFPVIMGRRTWESLPFRPLPGRQNIVLSTRNPGKWSVGANVVTQLPDEGWIIGGGEVYAATLPLVHSVERTLIDVPTPTADNLVYAPTLPETFECVAESEWMESHTGVRYRFQTWRRRGINFTDGTLEQI